MLTELQSPELYMHNSKINKKWLVSILLLQLDSREPKMVHCGVKFGVINLYLQIEQSCFRRF